MSVKDDNIAATQGVALMCEETKGESFAHFKLDEHLLKAIGEMGYEKPTSIQLEAIPQVLEGADLIASARTGTGKTAAFLLPAIHKLAAQGAKEAPVEQGRQEGRRYNGARGAPQVLVLVPTRELAMQIANVAEQYTTYLPRIKTVCIYGGVPYQPQERALSRKYDLLIATPGRLMDLMERGRIDLSSIQLFVLDEADRMLDMGFVEAVEDISGAMSKKRQTLLFSATLDANIQRLSKHLQNSPKEIRLGGDEVDQSKIDQKLYFVDDLSHKMRLLDHLIEQGDMEQVIVFTSTIIATTEIADDLQSKGYRVAALHGKMNQRQRARTISKLRAGYVDVLVATDVAARGIDVSSITHVINVDLPMQAEDYIHRIGRTGRAGASGIAITFATYREEPLLAKIHRLTGKPMETLTIAGLEPRERVKGGGGFSDKRRGGGRPFGGNRSRGDGAHSSFGRFQRSSGGEKRQEPSTDRRGSSADQSRSNRRVEQRGALRDAPRGNWSNAPKRGNDGGNREGRFSSRRPSRGGWGNQ